MCEGGRVICCAVPAHTPTGPGTQHEPWTKTCCSSNWWTCLQGWPPLCASPPAGQQPRSPSKASRLSNLPGNEEGDKGETRERRCGEGVATGSSGETSFLLSSCKPSLVVVR